jgi:hypothetical protein
LKLKYFLSVSNRWHETPCVLRHQFLTGNVNYVALGNFQVHYDVIMMSIHLYFLSPTLIRKDRKTGIYQLCVHVCPLLVRFKTLLCVCEDLYDLIYIYIVHMCNANETGLLPRNHFLLRVIKCVTLIFNLKIYRKNNICPTISFV